jgi:hypothetical protein
MNLLRERADRRTNNLPLHKAATEMFSRRRIAHEPHAQIDLLIAADSDYIPANNNNNGNALGS